MCPAAAAAASMCNNNIIMGGIIYFHYTSTHSAVFVAFSSSFLDIFILFYFIFSELLYVHILHAARHHSCCIVLAYPSSSSFFCGFLLLCVYICARRDQTTTHLIQCQSGHSFLSRIPCGALFSFACFFFLHHVVFLWYHTTSWNDESADVYSNVGVLSPINPEIEYSLHNHFDSRLQFCACVYSLGWAVIYSHAGQVEKYFFESSGPFFFFGRPSSSIAKIKADAEFRIKE
jgi:hypothetical protein